MEIIKRNKERYEYMAEILKIFKNHGLDVYINKPDKMYSFCYGLITNGKDICYIQYGYYGGFIMSYKYVPSVKHGSGVTYPYDGNPLLEITEKSFYDCVENGNKYIKKHKTIKKYNSIQDFMKDKWNKENYIQI